MSYFLIYLIKSTVYLGLFYAFFLIAMRGTTFFRFNRWMLMLGSVVCMLLPCYTLTVEEVEGMQLPMQVLDEILVLRIPEEVQTDSTLELPIQEVRTSVSAPILPMALLGIYLLGVLIYLAMVVRSFKEVWKLIVTHPKQWKDGCWLVILPDKTPSFSWSNYIIISEEDYRNYPQVLVHERMHYLCRHSYDILFMTFVHALHWFNPMVWLIRTELKQLHEFEADEKVISQGIDATQYQILLVKKAIGPKLYTIANGFNHTKLKKRITMMIQEKSNGWERLKWLIAVPVVTGAMLLFTEVEETAKDEFAYYKEYFQAQAKKFNFFDVKREYHHDFIVNANQAYFDDKDIHTLAHAKANVSELIQASITTGNEAHLINFQYDSQTDKHILCAYMQEIKEAYEDAGLTPLVFINHPWYTQPEEKKRYYGIKITFGNKDAHSIKNFTITELGYVAKQTSNFSNKNEYVRIGFQATKEQKMENVNEVRRFLRDFYKPQQVIFSQTVLKD